MSNRTIMPGQGLDFDDPNQSSANDGPVECLGKIFENDAVRREHYLGLLAEKLKDPEFRKIEGFPIGEDENILNLSDPPYYTACPNPFIEEFVAHYGRTYDTAEKYKREPYAADVSEGKSDHIYSAHTYHTKVPPKAIMRYFLHYTQPGDVVFDGFSGSGMAGVAAQMCGNEEEILKLGYQINEENGEISESGSVVSKLGVRKAVISDLSPSANNIAYGNNYSINVGQFLSVAGRIINETERNFGWLFKTKDPESGSIVDAKYYVWSEILSCSNCGGEVIFAENALSDDYKKVSDEFKCPDCSTSLNKKKLEVVYESVVDDFSGQVVKRPKRVVSLVCFSRKRRNIFKRPDSYDMELIQKANELGAAQGFPCNAIPDMQMMRVGRMKPSKVTHMNHFYCQKTMHVLSSLWGQCNQENDFRLREILCYWLDSHFVNLSLRNRFRPGVSFPYNPMAGVFYIPMMCSEANPFVAYKNKIDRIVKAFSSINRRDGDVLLGCCSATATGVPDNSIDYIFTDPPFGENIYYSDLNYFIESWRNVFTNTEDEAIIDKVKEKGLLEYIGLMQASFHEYYRIIKPGRWMTVEFSNTKSSVWNGIQTALTNAGFVIANVAALDKQLNTFQAVNSSTAVKQDLVISAYKPNGGFEERFLAESDEEGVWDFVRTHLSYLPIFKKQSDELVKINERDPRILYDQVVSYFVKNLRDVPVSSKEFQLGLEERFSTREGMIFLPEQVAEYDKARISSKQLKQLSIFVDDEASAIEWLRQLLNEKPQSYQDMHPRFISELSGWKKAEEQLELSTILEQNFIKYDGAGPLPPQIHSYLSTNFKEFRRLKKDDTQLIKKAKDRWYVPNPEREEDLQKLRERSLLSEFEDYKKHTGKKLKKVRMEAIRCGFKKAWQERDYPIIISVAEKIPQDLLQEDQKLLMWYDQAQTRASDDSLF
jgi:DNA modification methylase